MKASTQIVLIHGTFAQAVEDHGDHWWQRGSNFWNKFAERLEQLGCSTACHRVFHWNGQNSERERIAAGIELFNWLHDQFEKSGRPYHVIAHSHGGSILWFALCESVRRGRPLHHLETWCTVGTPFLHFGARVQELWFALPLLATSVVLRTCSRSRSRAATNGPVQVVDADSN